MNTLSKAILTILSFAAMLAGCKGSQIDDGFAGGLAGSATQSALIASSSTVVVGKSVTIQLSIKDQNGNLFYLPSSPPQVSFALASNGTSTGTFGNIQDQQNGNFTTTFTGVTAGTATSITATVNGTKISNVASIQVTLPANAFTLNIPFTYGTSSSYSISNTSSVSLMASGGVQLSPADQSDTSSNTGALSGGFQNGTLNGVQWDSINNILRLNSTTNNAELDASWTPQWSSLVGYWKMNEAGGATTVADSSPVGTTSGGIASGVTMGVTGQLKTAASFSGTSSSYVDMGANYNANHLGRPPTAEAACCG